MCPVYRLSFVLSARVTSLYRLILLKYHFTFGLPRELFKLLRKNLFGKKKEKKYSLE